MGAVAVPRGRRYGAETARAVQNFPTAHAGMRLGDFPDLVRGLLKIKQAAARANRRTGYIDILTAGAIDSACDEILRLKEYGRDFPTNMLHGGGGTSANMNVNEVVAQTVS